MPIMPIPWEPLRSSFLASPEPLETELTPTSSYATPYVPNAAYGQVATAAGNSAAYMTVGWQPRRGVTDVPYVADDLLVGAGADDPVVTTPGDGSGTGAGATAPGTTPGSGAVVTPGTGGSTAQVRPPAPPRVNSPAARLRTTFVKSGLRVRVTVPATARVEIVLTHTATTRKNGKKVHTTRKISRTAVAKKLPAGRNTLVTLQSSAAGRRLLAGRTSTLNVKMEIVVTYTDRTTVRVVKPVALTAPKSRKSTR